MPPESNAAQPAAPPEAAPPLHDGSSSSRPSTVEEITTAVSSQTSGREEDTQAEAPRISSPPVDADVSSSSSRDESLVHAMPPQQDMEREQSAEEVLQASIDFERSTPYSFIPESSSSTRRTSLYPSPSVIQEAEVNEDASEEEEKEEISAEDRSTPYSCIPDSSHRRTSLRPKPRTGEEEEKEEITDLASAPLYAVVPETTEEATVLGATRVPDETSFQDENLTAMERAAYDDENLIAMKRAAYNGADADGVAQVRRPSHPDQEATVVAITDDDVHPADISPGAVQAELIGQDYSRNVEVPTTYNNNGATNEVGTNNAAAYAAVEAESVEDTATEATVIDSAPLDAQHEGEVPPWKTEEAQVLEDDTSIPWMDRKPPAHDSNDDDERFAVADQEAEILGIQEEVHPAELTRDDAEATLVGTDPNYNVAVPASGANNAVTEVIVEQDTGTQYTETAERPNEVVEGAAVLAEDVTPQQTNRSTSEATEIPLHATVVEEDYAVVPSTPSTIKAPSSIPPIHPSNDNAPTNPFVDDDEAWMRRPSSIGSDGPPVAAIPPPSSDEAEQQDSVPDWLADGPPAPQGFAAAGNTRTASTSSANSSQTTQSVISGITRSTGQVMGALFGDVTPLIGRRARISSNETAGSILPRTLLPWSVIYSPATHMWVATLQTNQKALDRNNVAEASKSLRAFSLPTEKQSICLARAWTPPRMLPFHESPSCHICHSRFAVFHRACHCRNCGVCICKDCTVLWPCKMIPDTYNTKRENSVHICKACDWLCTAFRLALLDGNRDKAVALHATGNVNLNTPFGNVKGELFYPVHCAVLGKNLSLLQWLVDDNCCPIKSVRVSGLASSGGKYTQIVTSKGRSLLGIALENESVDIVRYLVVEKGIVLSGEKDVTADMLIRNLDSVLRLLPANIPSIAGAVQDSQLPEELPRASSAEVSSPIADLGDVPPIEPGSFDEEQRRLSEAAENFGAVNTRKRTDDDGSGEAPDHKDECIICFDAKIDCVATPCGHQICCLACSEHMSRCPVCGGDCSFLRVFKP